MADLTIANTILAQMGGTKALSLMLGAHSFVGDKDRVWFSIKAKNAKKINKIVVILMPDDTYTVEFWRVWGGKMTKIESVEVVYCDNLISVCESVTGLVFRLPIKRK